MIIFAGAVVACLAVGSTLDEVRGLGGLYATGEPIGVGHDGLLFDFRMPWLMKADKAALKLAKLGRPAKVMLGGMTGWADEGFPFEHSSEIAV